MQSCDDVLLIVHHQLFGSATKTLLKALAPQIPDVAEKLTSRLSYTTSPPDSTLYFVHETDFMLLLKRWLGQPGLVNDKFVRNRLITQELYERVQANSTY